MDIEKSTRDFSIKRLIENDYTTGFFTYAIFIVWIMYFIFLMLDLSFLDASSFKIIPILTTGIGIPFLMWRIYFFRKMYKCGVETTGTIVFAAYLGRGDRVIYEYSFQNKKYKTGNGLAPVFLSENGYKVGDEIILLVNPKKPKKAVIKDIYF
jgi:hypothetical protein